MSENKKRVIPDKNKYRNFTAEDLLKDPFFLKSMKEPTLASRSFWKEIEDEGFIEKKEVEVARSLLSALLMRKKTLDESELSSLRKKISQANLRNKKKRRITWATMMAVASILLLAAITTFFLKDKSESRSIMEVASLYKASDYGKDIQIRKGEGQALSISEEDADIEITQQGDWRINSKAVQRTGLAKEEQTEQYSELIVPKGKRSTLLLSDGTRLWVNAGSRIVFPDVFNTTKREIFLDGEIYIEVHPDKSRPFIVNTKSMNVCVLGTSFNMTAYEEDHEQSVVLVTGLVTVSTNNHNRSKLYPNERFCLSEGKSEISAVDPTNYISWKDGWYISDSEDLGLILDRLARYYGKTLVFGNDVSNLKCSGRLNLRDNLIDLLEGLKKTLPITYSENESYIKIQMSNINYQRPME